MKLVWPSREYLPSYIAALERGWSPDNLRGHAAAQEELKRIAADADAFLASLVDKEAAGDPITLPDGTTVPRLPGYRRWLWDGEFCGSIDLRWQRGTEALPPHCLGHIGYAVVSWKQGRGYATRALRDILRDAGSEGLRYVEITTDPDNLASRRVIEANAGVLVEEFVPPATVDAKPKLRYRVPTQGVTMELKFPAPVPEIPVTDINKAAAYYQTNLGFTLDWGGQELGLAGISKDNCRMFLANQEYRKNYGNVGPTLTWLNLDSKEQVDELYRVWSASEVKLVSAPESKPWGLYEFTAADLDGNLLRVFYDFETPEHG